MNWTERICIDSKPISWQDLQASLATVESAIQAENPDQPTPTQFEVITAAAWQYFASQKVDVAIVEVGLGRQVRRNECMPKPSSNCHCLYQPRPLAASWVRPLQK